MSTHTGFLNKFECTASFQLSAEVQTPSAEQAQVQAAGREKYIYFQKMMPISCSKIYRTCFSHGNLSYLNYIQDDYSVEAPGFQDKNIKLNESSMIIFHD